ncbi:MAG: DUF748 domain-containing protein [Candidatus Omnitrophica bacterium]|nr:DUF748 domain-containing protein [Candidatus Omnitrophota bacterium]
MNTFVKTLFIILVVLTVIFLCLHIFVKLEGKKILAAKIQEITKKNTQIGSVILRLPLNLEINKLEIEGFANIEKAFISPGILGFLTGNPAFNEIKIKNAEFNFKIFSPLEKKEESLPSRGGIFLKLKRPPINFIFRKIIADNVTFNFVDYNIIAEGFKLTLKNTSLKIENLLFFPVSIITHFSFRGELPWPSNHQKGELHISGWVNLYKKDMQAHLEINNIDGTYFYPYYSNWVDLEKARIQEATLNFISDISGLNNNVVANCTLELVEITFKPKPDSEPEDRAYRIARGILDMFSKQMQADKKISLNFVIHTKMTEPEFRFENLRLAFEDKLTQGLNSARKSATQIFSLPLDFLKGSVKGTTDITKVLVQSTIEIGKVLKDIFIEPFKKENKQE